MLIQLAIGIAKKIQKTWQVMAPLALGLPRLHYPESQSRPQAVEDKLAQLEVAKQDCWESGSSLGTFTEGHNTPIPCGQGSEHNFLEGSKEKDRTFLFFAYDYQDEIPGRGRISFWTYLPPGR